MNSLFGRESRKNRGKWCKKLWKHRKWKSKVWKAGEPMGSRVWAELLWGLLPPSEIYTQISCIWVREELLLQLVLWHPQRLLQELQDCLSFLLSRKDCEAPFPNWVLERTITHMSCCCWGWHAAQRSRPLTLCISRSPDALRCTIKAAL